MKFSKLIASVAICTILPFTASVANAITLKVGFSQIGAESEWRKANSKDIVESAKNYGIDLTFEVANQKQEDQIASIRKFIDQKVDLIGFVPIVATGWDEVLREAKKAKIPVLVMDRDLLVSDPSLYVSKIGSDSYTEGRKVFNWIDDHIITAGIKPRDGGKKINIVIFDGTTGASVTTGRKNGFFDALYDSKNRVGYNILAEKGGDFTRQSGADLMREVLEVHKNSIDVLFAMNDDMALGAIKEIEKAGLKPGKDIIVISIDGIREIFEAIIDGKANATVECNPLQGNMFFETAFKVMKGEHVPKSIFVEESIFTIENAERELLRRNY